MLSKKIEYKKVNIPFYTFLCIVTLGVFYFLWSLDISRHAKALNGGVKSKRLEFVCFILVPYYSIYWFYRKSELVYQGCIKNDFKTVNNSLLVVLLSVFKLKLVALIILQSQLNRLYNRVSNSEINDMKEDYQKVELQDNAAFMIIVSLVSFGIYKLYWVYHMEEDLRFFGLQSKTHRFVICLLFIVPFYSVYWFYTRSTYLYELSIKEDLPLIEKVGITTILGLLKRDLVGLSFIQEDLNLVYSLKDIKATIQD